MEETVLIVMGSHRQAGYSGKTVAYLEALLNEHAIRTVVVDVNGLKIDHCIDCGYCSKNKGRCVFTDDMDEIYKLLKDINHMVVVSPVYFNGIGSRLKTLVDRCQMIFMSEFAFKTPYPKCINQALKGGYLISFGGANAYENQFIGNEATIGLLMRNLKMPLKSHLKYAGTDHWEKERLPDAVTEDIQAIVKHILKR